jgi:hypothetical protein
VDLVASQRSGGLAAIRGRATLGFEPMSIAIDTAHEHIADADEGVLKSLRSDRCTRHAAVAVRVLYHQ